MQRSRRDFVLGVGSLAAASVLPAIARPKESDIKFGYAAITWDGNDTQAIKDVSEVGFRGIQLRANILKEFSDDPKKVADLLQQYRLQLVALSGGGPRGGADFNEAEVIETQVKQTKFLKAAGGLYLQMTDSARPKGRNPSAEDFKKLGHVLTEVGKRTMDVGVPLAYHNHMGSLSQGPDEMDAVMDTTDPRYVKLLLDVAHCAQGGGDPAKAIRKYRDQIQFLHLKDVESTGGTGSASYRFVELGRGRVDLPAVFAALKEIKFHGWAVVELDRVPDSSRTPKESAIISKKYLEQKLGMKV